MGKNISVHSQVIKLICYIYMTMMERNDGNTTTR